MPGKLLLFISVFTISLHYSTQSLPLAVDSECLADCAALPKEGEFHCLISDQWINNRVYSHCQHVVVVLEPWNTPCQVLTGMSVVVECGDNATLYRSGEASLNESSYWIPYVTWEDGGMYECIHENGSLYAHRNLSVGSMYMCISELVSVLTMYKL